MYYCSPYDHDCATKWYYGTIANVTLLDIFRLVCILTNPNEFDSFISHVCKCQVKVHHFVCSDLRCLFIPSDLLVCEILQQFD